MSNTLIDHVLSNYSGKIDCNFSVMDSAISDHKLLRNIKAQVHKPKDRLCSKICES